MCPTDLECLQLINENILDIKAFCFALAVALGLSLVLFVLNKFVAYTIGQAF